jgi:transcriptional regulator with XRE-family HTH domain
MIYADFAYISIANKHYGVETIRTKRHQQLVEILVAERKKAGIRQVDLAEQLGVSQTWVVRMESGGRRIDVIEFMALAQVIGFSPVRIIKALAETPDELFAR